ncbi:hypothetical protein ZOSMA_32G00950 [Zostera marina]|uniref:Uncharacterized protein n=1 Tax=Zostera marina TaxID=29655 RepID=A0A0K9P8G8_ZOSMR|nr:hypothetical protein ZOSMA_32G00950 [Zostera marina]
MWIDKTVQIFSREAKGVVYSLNACNGKLLVAFNQKIQLNKIGRDSLYYVEPLIESIMGGLEGLINILDSDSGFVSLEMQLHPDQAVIRMIQASKVSTSFVKSTKGVYGLPGYESCRSGNISVKVLEVATQRLTSLCSVLNDMEPICVLNHIFVLREYMRDCFLANFRKRLLMVLRIENYLQRPSVVESLIRRHIRIIHLAEQHISMDLTEVRGGSALEIVCNWYVENIVKDTIGADVYFAPFHNCFKSSKAFEGNTAEAFTNIRELKSIFRIFGGYRFDTLDRMVRKNVASLLNSIETSLRSNLDALEAISENINSCGKVERETNLKQILDIETVIGFCIQVGHALTFQRLLVESAKAILEEKAPLFVSLLSGVVKQVTRFLKKMK